MDPKMDRNTELLKEWHPAKMGIANATGISCRKCDHIMASMEKFWQQEDPELGWRKVNRLCNGCMKITPIRAW